MPSLLTDEEKTKVRFHLGYPNVTRMTVLTSELPAPRQLGFLLEPAMDALLPDAVALVRQIICQMDKLECQLFESADRMQASAVGNLKMRADEQDALEKLYVRFGRRLADVLGVPPYPLSVRYQTSQTVNLGPYAGNLRMHMN
jgi:hypothetical protein